MSSSSSSSSSISARVPEDRDVSGEGETETVNSSLLPDALSSATFESLGIETRLFAEALRTLNWSKPTKVQEQAIPLALAGRDVIALAQTGSGKTGAFALPILQDLKLSDGSARPPGAFALVLVPSRELAFQIEEVFKTLGAGLGALKCATIVGGMDVVLQAAALAKRPHIVVATPGRLLHHLENTKGFHLNGCKYLVLDEADRLLSMDFEDAVDKMLRFMPNKRATFLFSATMTSKVTKLERASLQEPVKIQVSAKYEAVSTLDQRYLFIPAKYKDCYLVYMLNDMGSKQCIVFTDTVANAQRLAIMLRTLGFRAVPLHGKLSQEHRLAALHKFVAHTNNILIATDVASRGLDIPMVDMVVNYDVPQQSKDYMHRVGRTARAGQLGRAVTIVTQYDVEVYQRIEKLMGTKLEAFPTDEEAVVLTLNERVADASRMAVKELKEETEKRQRNSVDKPPSYARESTLKKARVADTQRK